MTRTFVTYFSDDQLGPIVEAQRELVADFEARRPHLRETDRIAAEQRINAVGLAIARLNDEVPE